MEDVFGINKKRLRRSAHYQRQADRSSRDFLRRDVGLKSRVSTVIQLAASLAVAAEDLKYEDLPSLDATGFYEQVRRFEISLIERALWQASGSQVKAARLLKMKLTTLNSKVKKYGLDPKASFRLREDLLKSKTLVKSKALAR